MAEARGGRGKVSIDLQVGIPTTIGGQISTLEATGIVTIPIGEW
jgi:hypothetical protein